MTQPSAWPPRPALWLILSLLSAQVLPAQQQQILIDLNLGAFGFPFTGPFVTSDASATLFGPTGRLYEQIIFGHKIQDVTNARIRYQKDVIKPDGYATSSSGLLAGDFFACFAATAVAHVNAFNLHQSDLKGPQCTEIIDIEPPPPPPKENCPILLDLGLNGFHLSGPDPAVSFDIDADGTLDHIAWTKAGGDDAFLCMDRNHNGVIDDGIELFGYATPLLSRNRALIGYRALAELDRPELGGNLDGKVDAHDATFHELCAWNDTNRDGMSQADEIHRLEDTNVAALEYVYTTTRLRDAYGNLFRYVSRAQMRTPSGGFRSWPTYDVLFAE